MGLFDFGKCELCLETITASMKSAGRCRQGHLIRPNALDRLKQKPKDTIATATRTPLLVDERGRDLVTGNRFTQGVKRLDLTQLPGPIVYLVDKVFEENTVNMIVSPPGWFKTWCMYS